MKVFVRIEKLAQIRGIEKKIVSGLEMSDLPEISNAWLAVKDGVIEDFGNMESFDPKRFEHYERIDCEGKMVLPTWVDSHTHIVFASWREQEFGDRVRGLSYEQIAERGGGILNSAAKLRSASEDALFESAKERLDNVISLGTGAIEVKSGYGLDVDSELKMLRVIKRLSEASPIPVKATFLGAHAFPMEYRDRQDAYVDLIIEEMLPQVAAEGLAAYMDVFCEKGYFSVEQTERLLSAGIEYGLKPKVHVNQFNIIGGIEACVKHKAVSVDHLEVLNEQDLAVLKGSNTIPVALPSCSFFLGIPYTPAREIMNAGLPLALASDFNPGSTPSGNMNFVVSLASVSMRMTTAEAINAATLNGAACLELSDELGSITRGKRANLMVTAPISSLDFIPYNFGQPSIEAVYINGERFEKS